MVHLNRHRISFGAVSARAENVSQKKKGVGVGEKRNLRVDESSNLKIYDIIN